MKHLVLVMLIRMAAASLFLLLLVYCSYNIRNTLRLTVTLTLTTVNFLLCELSKWMILPSNGRIT